MGEVERNIGSRMSRDDIPPRSLDRALWRSKAMERMDLGTFQRAESATEWILSDAGKARGARWLCGLRPSSLRLVPLVPWAPFRSWRSALRCLAFGYPLATDRHEKGQRVRLAFPVHPMGSLG